jgi:hypothetical protein
MKVECIADNILELEQSISPYEFCFLQKTLGEKSGISSELWKGNHYDVNCISIVKGRVSFYISQESDSVPSSYPHQFFKIVDSRISQYCGMYKKSKKGQLLITFKEWALENSFYSNLIDREPRELEIFRTYKRLMLLEFPDPKLKIQGQILKDNWVMCPECNEAWEVFDNSGILICPKCSKYQNNPLYRTPKELNVFE